MGISIDKSRPVCPQIEEFICIKIAKGEYKSGDRIMSVRELASLAVVNPNTVQKAFEGLEAKGLLKSVRGSGWFLGESSEKAREIVGGLIKKETDGYIRKMRDLGLGVNDIVELIRGEENG